MAARKLSISMDEELADEVIEAARAEGTTVSAWIAEQISDRVALLGLSRLVDEYEAEFGAFTEEELAAAKAKLDAAGVADHRARPARREQAS